jgi:hypothetical protein
MTHPAACPACFASLSPDARYCHRCGRAVTAGGSSERAPWIIAWSLVLLALGGIVYFVVSKNSAPARPDMANVGAEPSGSGGAAPAGGAPPDISQMTPRERFLRLDDRIAKAAAQGDTAMALRFAPMAISAYGMLDSYDPDVRYHAGAVHIQLGEYPAALALADTIQQDVKDHLFADMLRAEVAQAKGDQAAMTRSRKVFLQHYDAQIATGRPEYQEHRAMLDEFKRQAQR